MNANLFFTHTACLYEQVYLRKVLEGWFLDLDIGHLHHDNVAQWTCWAFFNKKVGMYSVYSACSEYSMYRVYRVYRIYRIYGVGYIGYIGY